ncbi:Uncharacterised protein [Vibrio cholerae]|nr:Uncharacterised protein [Vibrio cholerae]CSC74086.1 Uncharacterised protein [Vibrio cholerae]CSD44132.1 Uncharacterised protein [Vibrio cholerae]
MVRITEPASAGSSLNLSKIIGINTPNNAAVIMLTTIASAMVAPITGSWNQSAAIPPMISAQTRPLIEPMPSSFFSKAKRLPTVI